MPRRTRQIAAALLRAAACAAALGVGGCLGDDPTLPGGLNAARDVTGTWTGLATLYSNCANPACRYDGADIILTLQQNGTEVAGTVDIRTTDGTALISGWTCTALSGQSAIAHGNASSSNLTFDDAGGHAWDLDFTTDTMRGSFAGQNDIGCNMLRSSDVVLSRGGMAANDGTTGETAGLGSCRAAATTSAGPPPDLEICIAPVGEAWTAEAFAAYCAGADDSGDTVAADCGEAADLVATCTGDAFDRANEAAVGPNTLEPEAPGQETVWYLYGQDWGDDFLAEAAQTDGCTVY